jgi:hypothetical protein
MRSSSSAAGASLAGEELRRMGIWLITFFNSFRSSRVRPRISGPSSSLPDEAESGGDITAPLGIPRSSVIGSGDCRTLPEVLDPAKPLRSVEVPGGVSWVVEPFDSSADADRRCFVRYEADRGSVGRCDPVCKEGRRLTSGDTGAEDAGDR